MYSVTQADVLRKVEVRYNILMVAQDGLVWCEERRLRREGDVGDCLVWMRTVRAQVWVQRGHGKLRWFWGIYLRKPAF
jgi:hypothetical protein